MFGYRLASESRVLATIVGFAPVFVLALTWDKDGASTQFAREIREYALPILAVEGIIIGVAALTGLFAWLKRAPRYIVVALAFWFVVAAATALFVAVRRDLSIFLTCIWIVHGLFGASIAFLIKEEKIEPNDLASALLAGFLTYGLAITVFALQVDHKIHWVTDVPGLGNLRRVAAYATICAGLGLGFARSRKDVLAISAVIAALFIAFWTGARATVPAVAVGILVACIVWPSARGWRIWLVFGVALAAALLLAAIFPVEMEQGTTRYRAITEVGDNGRLRIWTLTAQAIGQSPIFGYGEGQTALILPHNPALDADFQAHPHNVILQVLMAWGLIGLAALAVVGGWLISLLLKGDRVATAPFGIGACALAAHAMIDGALYDVAPVFVFAAVVGTAFGSSTVAQRKT